jgi:hypothetical protein
MQDIAPLEVVWPSERFARRARKKGLAGGMTEHEGEENLEIKASDVGGSEDIVRASALVRELHTLAKKNDWPAGIIVLAGAGDVGILPDGQVAEHGACLTVWHLPDDVRSSQMLPGFGWLGLLFAIMFRLWAAAVEFPPSGRSMLLLRINRAISEVAA